MGAGCGIISTACNVAASGNLSCTAEFCVQGQAQAQDKNTHFSEFQRTKEDRQMDVRKLKGTLKQVAVSALFAVGYTEKENSKLAVQRIIRCSFVKFAVPRENTSGRGITAIASVLYNASVVRIASWETQVQFASLSGVEVRLKWIQNHF